MPHSTSPWDTSTTAATPAGFRSDSGIFDSNSNIHQAGKCPCATPDESPWGHFRRRQSQQSILAKAAMSNDSSSNAAAVEQRRRSMEERMDELRNELDRTLSRNGSNSHEHGDETSQAAKLMHAPMIRNSSLSAALHGELSVTNGASRAMNDTPATTAPSSPGMKGNYLQLTEATKALTQLPTPMRQASGSSTPRARPTTLDIPGLTKSKASPDGRIASRDVGAKLVIVMVGLPARGKSYITKKLARYLNWLQHDTRIFNVGERRREVAGGPHALHKSESHANDAEPQTVAQILLNDELTLEPPATPPPSAGGLRPLSNATKQDLGYGREDALALDPRSPTTKARQEQEQEEQEAMEQDAAFFDPDNKKASQIREQVARETLDELLDYILHQNGSVGIFDATNSTLERRKMIMERIRERGGPDLNVLFLESRCVDQELLESNMRLKLNGPDYKDKDPQLALEDFKKRIQVYEKAYVPLGDYEEKNNMPYIQMIDVGRKIISHQIKGFLSAQANYYLLNFNLAPRQIWVTRHGLSMDNISGRIGGDSDLAPEGVQYAKSLAKFMDEKRLEWDLKQIESIRKTHFPPQPGDATPPNPYYNPQSPTTSRSNSMDGPSTSTAPTTPDPELSYEPKPFCVWTSISFRCKPG